MYFHGEEPGMSRFRAAVLASVAGLLLGSPAEAQTLTMSSWAPASHPLTRVVMQGFADELAAASGGRLKVKMLDKHPVPGPATFDAVRDDVVDISVAVTDWLPQRHILTRIAEFPGAGETAEINSVAYSRLHFRRLAQAGEYEGVHLVGVFTHGPGHVFTTRRPVASLVDLLGVKIRTGGGSSEAIVRALGGLPVVTSVPQESHDLLASGAVEATFFPQDSFASFKLEGIVKYATLFPGGLFNYSFGLIMNEGKWRSLSKEDQELITRLGGEHLARRAGKAWDDADRRGREAMNEARLQIDVASAELVDQLRRATRPMLGAWMEEVKDKRKLDGAALLREYQEEIGRVAREQ
jgi:TRAP-type C4-dicarboxylate transport system substrate-binding protein